MKDIIEHLIEAVLDAEENCCVLDCEGIGIVWEIYPAYNEPLKKAINRYRMLHPKSTKDKTPMLTVSKFTKEGSIDVQVSFQEIWRQVPIGSRSELFGHFVHVTEFLESLVLIAPSARTPLNETCSRIKCVDSCTPEDPSRWWNRHPSANSHKRKENECRNEK